MARPITPPATTYQGWLAHLGDRTSRKVAHNTYAVLHPDGVAIRFHRTDILVFHPDGTITVDTGGWHTATTKTRLNAFLPGGITVWQKDFRWYVCDGTTRPFEDGMTLGKSPFEAVGLIYA